MKRYKIKLFAIFCFLLFYSSTAEAKFINTWLSRIQGAYSSGDEKILAKYDMLFGTKAQHNDIGGGNGDTWAAIHALNGTPEYAAYTEIYLYEMAHFSSSAQDNNQTIYTNNIARYVNDRNHPDGNISHSNPTFHLEKVGGGFLMQKDKPNDTYALDFGNSDFHAYSIRAIKDDFIGQDWEADGVYSDLALAYNSGSVNGTPVKYPTKAAWTTAMNGFLNSVTAGLHSVGKKFACNRGLTRFADGKSAWLALDTLPNPPDAVIEEGAFVVLWGADAWFFTETEWKRQVDTLASIRNSKALYLSHAKAGSVDGSCLDNYGNSVTFREALWYAMGSFLLGKNDTDDNSYFMMRYGINYGATDLYYPEYDEIDLGKAVAGYNVTNFSGKNIYWREFSDGYIYVNPTNNDVSSIPLPEKCKRRSHENLLEPLDDLSDINTISLKGHRTAILYKSIRGGSLSPPSNLKIVSN